MRYLVADNVCTIHNATVLVAYLGNCGYRVIRDHRHAQIGYLRTHVGSCIHAIGFSIVIKSYLPPCPYLSLISWFRYLSRDALITWRIYGVSTVLLKQISWTSVRHGLPCHVNGKRYRD